MKVHAPNLANASLFVATWEREGGVSMHKMVINQFPTVLGAKWRNKLFPSSSSLSLRRLISSIVSRHLLCGIIKKRSETKNPSVWDWQVEWCGASAQVRKKGDMTCVVFEASWVAFTFRRFLITMCEQYLFGCHSVKCPKRSRTKSLRAKFKRVNTAWQSPGITDSEFWLRRRPRAPTF